MRIDVHAHWYPREYLQLLTKLGRSDLAGMPGQPADFSARIEQLDAAGVQCQCLSAVGLNTEVEGRDASVAAARHINDAYAEIAARYPGRLQAFGWVPLPHVDEAIDEALRCLNTLQFAGIALPCFPKNHSLDDPSFEPFWAELDRHSAVLYVHPVGAHSRCNCGMDRYTLDILAGSPTQETVTASRLVYSGVTRRYKNLRFIFAGLGGTLPYLFPIHEQLLKRAYVGPGLQGWVRENEWLDAKDPMAEFRRFHYDTSTQEAPLGLLLAAKAFGASQLVFGSDAPHGNVTGAVQYIQQSEYLSADEKRAVLDEHAQRVLRLDSNARPIRETGAVQ